MTKNLCNLPSCSSWSNKGYCLYQLCFAKHIYRDTKWARSVPQACSDGKLDNLQVWRSKITAQIGPPGWQGTLLAWSVMHFKELKATFKFTCSHLVRSAGYFWWPEADVHNMNLWRWYAITHTLLNRMEGSDPIILTPHPEFNPCTAWPRATVSTSHYLPPSNSVFKAKPSPAPLLQQWREEKQALLPAGKRQCRPVPHMESAGPGSDGGRMT